MSWLDPGSEMFCCYLILFIACVSLLFTYLYDANAASFPPIKHLTEFDQSLLKCLPTYQLSVDRDLFIYPSIFNVPWGTAFHSNGSNGFCLPLIQNTFHLSHCGNRMEPFRWHCLRVWTHATFVDFPSFHCWCLIFCLCGFCTWDFFKFRHIRCILSLIEL
jgi:hypothetical protein